jgi:hypothetical protein
MRRLPLAALGACLVLSVAVGPVSGATTAWTDIRIHTLLTEPGGTFTASGGAICASGTTSDVVDAFQHGTILAFHDLKTFTCADGSGTFTLDVWAATKVGAPIDIGVWSVVSGTDAYELLRGRGTLIGTYIPDGIDDHLVGVTRLR